MAIRFVDGYDHYATADGSGKWTLFGGTRQTTTVRNGTGALQLGTDVTHRFTNPAGSNATGLAGFGYRITAAGATRNFLDFLDAGTVQVSLHVENDNTITAKRNGSTTIAQSTNVLSTNVWYWIECKVVINNATGTVEVRVNGTNTGWINASGLDTQQTANATFNMWGLDGNGTSFFDDTYFADGSSVFLGDSKVATVIASAGDGALAQWVPNAGTDNGDRVDDTTPDGNTTINTSAVVNDRDCYNFAALGFTGTVHALQLNNWVSKTDAGARVINGFTRIGGANFDGANFNPSNGTFSDAREIWETSPSSAVAWTVAEIDGAEFGIRNQA